MDAPATKRDIALRVRGVTKSYGSVRALDGVSIDFVQGEVHALVGENGAGKSTLVKVLTGCIEPDGGELFLDGKALRRLDPHAARALGIGVIYQEPSLVEDLSVAENVFLGDLPRRGLLVDRTAMAERARSILDDLGTPIDPATPVSALSVAQRQFVEVAKACALHARIIIFDEPTAPLTSEDAELLFALIGRLRAAGTAVVYISHRLPEIFRLADCITVMRDGRVVATRTASRLTRDELIRLMVGRNLAEVFPERAARPGEEVLRVEGLCSGMVRDVSFSLRRGEILGFAGLAGSGRTETMRALFGADVPEQGRLFIDGAPARISSPARSVVMGIGYAPEDRKREGLITELSIRDNVSLPILRRLSRLFVLDRSREENVVDEYRDGLHIKTPSTHQLVRNLSGGNQQKVVVGKWLASAARILIFDEPTQGIDVGARTDIYHMMNELTAQGYSIIMVSSDMEELIGMSDRIVVLSEGHVAGELSDRAEFTQERIMRLASRSMDERGSHARQAA